MKILLDLMLFTVYLEYKSMFSWKCVPFLREALTPTYFEKEVKKSQKEAVAPKTRSQKYCKD